MVKILIVEDEPLLAEAYAFLFRHKSYKVSIAYDGEEGLKMARKVSPDLIVLDMMMPKLDGFGFLERYAASEHPGVKIILLSNMQSPDHQAKAFALGISRYEIKASLSPTQLLDVVAQTLAKDG